MNQLQHFGSPLPSPTAVHAPPLIGLTPFLPHTSGYPTRLLLVDGDSLVREGLRSLLTQQSSIEVVGEVASNENISLVCATLAPDVLLLDIDLGKPDAIALVQSLATTTGVPVVILTGSHIEARAAEAIHAGAQSYVLKQSSVSVLRQAIKMVCQSKVFVDPALHDEQVRSLREQLKNGTIGGPLRGTLTVREHEVMKLISRGHRTADIALELHLSPKTVDTHRQSLMRKLDAHNVAEVSDWARRLGIIPLPLSRAPATPNCRCANPHYITPKAARLQ